MRETPVLELDDGAVVTQSPAILWFLAEDTPFLPATRMAREALDVLAAHLGGRDWLVGDGPTIADVAVFAYTSRAGDIELDPAAWPPVAAWLDRMRGLPGFVDDFVPYPANARAGAGMSIYG